MAMSAGDIAGQPPRGVFQIALEEHIGDDRLQQDDRRDDDDQRAARTGRAAESV